jgi:hypothetical protein
MSEDNQPQPLDRFFAVTISGSVYEINIEKSACDWPTVKRIIHPDNRGLGLYLRNGCLVGLGRYCICLFDPTPNEGRNFEEINMLFWGGSTTAIVGLFLEQPDAERCYKAGDWQALDSSFADSTKKTLQTIGHNHPFFVIGESLQKYFST